MKKKVFITKKEIGRMSEIVDKVTEPVISTMGPGGLPAILHQQYGPPRVTKDGVTVAKALDFADPLEDLYAGLLKTASVQTGDAVGDGTTTCMKISRDVALGGLRMLSAGANPVDLKIGIESAVGPVVKELEKAARAVTSKEDLEKIAIISANGDVEMGKKIAETMEEIGKDGIILAEEGKSLETTVEIVKGMNFDRGYLSPYFVTNSKNMSCEYENPYVFLYDKKVSSPQSIVPLLEQVLQKSRPLVIIAEDVESEALATLVVNRLRGGLKVVAIKAPGFGDRRKAMLEDIAVMAKATVVSEEMGDKLEELTLDRMGIVKKVVITKDDTTIIASDDANTSKAIDERVEMIKQQIAESTSDYDKEKLNERAARLVGGVGTIRVGGATEVEVKERKDRLDDAIHACKAAAEEGILAGGGVALLNTIGALGKLKPYNDDQRSGINIVIAALKGPAYTILENSGLTPEPIIEKIIEAKDNNTVYDVRARDFVDCYESGILDPMKVTRTAFQTGVSIAVNVFTSGALLVNDEDDDSGSGGGGGMPGAGGMGGMPGMGGF